MRWYGAPILVIGFVLLSAFYIVTRGSFPDPAVHQHVLISLLRTFQQDAALERDVLQVRAGALGNYDALNDHLSTLRKATDDLKVAGDIGGGSARSSIDDALSELVRALEGKRDLVERFKSNVALTHNSTRIFLYAAGRIGTVPSQNPDGAMALSQTAVAISAFLQRPENEARDRAVSALKKLDAEFRNGVVPDEFKELAIHGGLLVDYVPALQELVTELQNPAIEQKTRELQSRYLAAYNANELHAAQLQTFLIACAIALCAYNFVLVTRLATGAKRLERRASQEHAAAQISRRFVALPCRETENAIQAGLGQLATQSGADDVHLLIVDAERRVAQDYRWPSGGVGLSAHQVPEILSWAPERNEAVTHLETNDLGAVRRSWAVVRFPLQGAGWASGYLILRTQNSKSRFVEEDRALLAVVAEIFRSALERSRHEEERQALQKQLARAQRLEALGALAGSVAHEFNNILGAIRGHAEFASDLTRRDGGVRRHVGQILTASARAQTVIDKVLTFGRRRAAHDKPFDAGAALEEALALLRASLPKDVRFETAIESGVMLDGDVTELQQIALNLCTNASHAMAGQGVVRIGLSDVGIESEQALSHGRLSAGRYARVEVADAGPGIPENLLDRIFEPFFTTKKIGVGTGLGLSTVRDIVAAWGGAVDVESAPGRGAVMRVYLPASSRSLRDARDHVTARGNGETVLIVERDRASLERDEEILAALGYEPVGFTDAGQALAAVRGEPDRFRIGVIDCGFARDGLVDLPRRIAETGADLPLLLIGDPDEDADADYMREVGASDVLRRPLRFRDIADALARRAARERA